MKFTIKVKLFLAFAVVLILMLLMGGFSYQAFMATSDNVEDVMENYQMMVMFSEREIEHLEWVAELADSFIAGDRFTGELDHTECNFGQWYYDFAESEDYLEASPEFRDVFDRLEEPHRLLHQSAEEATHLLMAYSGDEGDPRMDQALDIYQDQTLMHIAETQSLLGELAVVLNEENAVMVDAMQAQEQATVMTILIVIGVSVLFVLLIVTILSRAISTPLNNVVTQLSELASSGGDLTKQLPVRGRDEIADLATAVNGFLESIRSIIEGVMDIAEGVNSGSESVSAASEEMSSSLEEVSASTNELASNAENLSTNSQDMSETNARILEQAEDGNQAIEEAVNQMQVISNRVSELQEVITEVDQRSSDIGKILNVITDIADQTNLLALNAAIEAARAGEQGRGFAVVAEEVRKLAEQSAGAAKEIGQLITSTQDESKKALESMTLGVKDVESGTEVVSKTGSTFNEILTNVKGISGQVEETASAAEELSAGSEEMAASIEEQSSTMEEMAATAEELRASAEKLFQELGKFKYQ